MSDRETAVQCDGGDGESPSASTERSATADEIEEWEAEHDGPHPVFRVPHRPERVNLDIKTPLGDSPDEDVACADCGEYRLLVGPLSFDGEVDGGGDFVCRSCADGRGLEVDST